MCIIYLCTWVINQFSVYCYVSLITITWCQSRDRTHRANGSILPKSEEAQISTPVYSLGDKVEDILISFNLKDDEVKKYDTKGNSRATS